MENRICDGGHTGHHRGSQSGKKGLGLRFLRHIERNSLLLFMVPADSDDIRKEYEVLLNELRTFNPEMLDKQRVLAITKSDMLDQELMDEIEPTLPEGIPHVFISSVSGLGISVLKDILWEELNKESNKIEDIVHRPKDVTRLQQELKDMGEDEELVYEYEEDATMTTMISTMNTKKKIGKKNDFNHKINECWGYESLEVYPEFSFCNYASGEGIAPEIMRLSTVRLMATTRKRSGNQTGFSDALSQTPVYLFLNRIMSVLPVYQWIIFKDSSQQRQATCRNGCLDYPLPGY